MKKNSLILLTALALFFTASSRCNSATLRATAESMSIQATIERAQPGDTVIIGEGRYVENILITKALVLRGDPAAKKVVIVARDSDQPVIKIEDASEVYVDGIDVKGSTNKSGILVLRSSKISIYKCGAKENRTGIALINTDDSTVRDNRTEYNTNYGIYLERSSGNTVSGNDAGQNSDKGIFLSYSNNNTITANNANHNTWNGILLWDSDNNTITENKIFRNMYSIIESESSGNLIENNSTLPNLFIILPIIMIYAGILFYLIQRLIVINVLSLMGKKK